MKLLLCFLVYFCINLSHILCNLEKVLEYPYKVTGSSRQKRDCTKYAYGSKTSVTRPAHKTQTDADNEDQTRLTLPIVDTRYTTITVGQYSYNQKDVRVHIAYIHDPARTVSVYEPLKDGTCSNHTRTSVPDSAKSRNCILATNAGFFNTSSGACLGNIVSDGRMVQDSEGVQNPHFGITKSGQIFIGYLSEIDLIADDFQQLVGGVIWIIKDGEQYVDESVEVECGDTEETGTLYRFATVVSARTVVGHDAEGRVMIVQFEGKTGHFGVNLYEAADILKKFGAVNAINLDGGGSSTLVINNTLVNMPSDFCDDFQCARNVSTILCVHEPYCETFDCNGHGTCELGVCRCNGYWTGSNCDVLHCPANCNHHGVCTEGGCLCVPGYYGDNCSMSCGLGWYGYQCSQQCQCENNATCDPVSGSCICPPGSTGKLCQYRCAFGFYGDKCSSQCECADHCMCDPVNGSCDFTYSNGDYLLAGICLTNTLESKHTFASGVVVQTNVAITTVIVTVTVLLVSVTLNIIFIWKYCSKHYHINKKVKYKCAKSSGNQMFIFQGKHYSSFTSSTCSGDEETSLMKLSSR